MVIDFLSLNCAFSRTVQMGSVVMSYGNVNMDSTSIETACFAAISYLLVS